LTVLTVVIFREAAYIAERRPFMDTTERLVLDLPADAVRAFIAEGLADIEAGRVVEADEVFDRLEARYQAMAERGR
jgi:hypothetical protein